MNDDKREKLLEILADITITVFKAIEPYSEEVRISSLMAIALSMIKNSSNRDRHMNALNASIKDLEMGKFDE